MCFCCCNINECLMESKKKYIPAEFIASRHTSISFQITLNKGRRNESANSTEDFLLIDVHTQYVPAFRTRETGLEIFFCTEFEMSENYFAGTKAVQRDGKSSPKVR